MSDYMIVHTHLGDPALVYPISTTGSPATDIWRPDDRPITDCSQADHGLFTGGSRTVHRRITDCSQADHGLFTGGLRTVHRRITGCSHADHGLFTCGSRAVHRRIADCS